MCSEQGLEPWETKGSRDLSVRSIHKAEKLSEDSTAEWKRACEAVGMDYGMLEFPNWNTKEDYTDEAYRELK